MANAKLRLGPIASSLLMALLATACGGPSAGRSLSDMLETIPPDGRVDLSIDEHGRFVRITVPAAANTLPTLVRDAVEDVAPGGELTSAARARYRGRDLWVVAKVVEGRVRTLWIDERGTVARDEHEVRSTEVPARIATAADAACAKGTVSLVTSVEERGRRPSFSFHRRTADGRGFRVDVREDGRVLDVVRDIDARLHAPD